MNAQNETTAVNTMQFTEAFPFEDRSLSANEVIAKQQSERVEENYTPTFLP